MEIISTLKQLGLSTKQGVVYLALLELGESTMTHIADKSKLKRPTVYLIIDELILLGLCSEVTKNKKKFYSAVHPRRLVEITHFRNKQAEKLLPELVALQNTAQKPKVRMLEGLEGMRTAYEEAFASLNNKEEGLWIGNTGILEEKFPEVLRLYNRTLGKLRNPKIREIIHGGEKSKAWVEQMQKARLSKNHYMRYADTGSSFGSTDQLILGNKVMTFVLGKEIFVLIVESKDNADTQRGVFELAWQKLEKIS
jgi:DNA-binding MarR family transcriptional regulator